MIDSAKIAKGLNYCLTVEREKCSLCPYIEGGCECMENLRTDIIQMIVQKNERLIPKNDTIISLIKQIELLRDGEVKAPQFTWEEK